MNRKHLIRAALFTPISRNRWGLPLLFEGPPGVGKTTMFRQIAAEAGLPIEVLSPAERGEGAFGVTPVPVSHDGKTLLSYPPPEWTEAMPVRGVVLVDEASSTPPALQPALLGLIQERMVGGKTLPPGVRVMGTANPAEQAAGGWDLAMPVANRLGHLNWDAPSAAEWGAALMGGSFDTGEVTAAPGGAEAEEARVLAAWPSAWARARGIVAGFLSKRSNLLLKPPEVGSPQASKAWPSPRSWENATRALASAYVHGLPGLERDTLITAFVGEGAAAELLAFLDKNDLPDPEEILDGKVKWSPDRSRLDVTDAVFGGMAALVIADKGGKKRQARTKALWKILQATMEDAADVVYIHAMALCASDLVFGDQDAIKTLARCRITILSPIEKATKE